VEVDFHDVGNQVRKVEADDIATAARQAKSADVAIVVVGENPLRQDHKGKTSGENVGRSSIALFGQQLDLIKAVHASGTPTVVVLVNSRPLSEPWVVDNVPALIEAWEPGGLGGQAVAEIIFGDVNPSGKLPITIPYSAGHIQSIYNHKPSAWVRQYADAPTRALFEFGDGLSYTEFKYGDMELSRSSISIDESVTASVTVTNSGDRAGDEVVQLYLRDDFSRVTRPVKELKGFQRLSLAPGETQTVQFKVTPDMLAYYNLDMKWGVEPGDFIIMAGSSSRDRDLKKATLTVKAE
jgi:beta-glucosidase